MANTNDVIAAAFNTARAGRPQQAVEDLQRSLRVHVDDPDLHENLGLLLAQMGQHDQALYHLQRATVFAPKQADFHSNYGTALNLNNKTKEAAEAYRKAIAADAKSFHGHLGLSSALFGLGDYNAAIDSATKAIELNPRAAEPAINLGLALTRAGRGAEAITVLREGRDRAGDNPMLLMNLAMALNYRPEASAQDIFDAHTRLGRATAATAGSAQPLFPDMNPDRRLRIGYLAADFPDRAVAWFLKPILANHDAAKFEVFCYSGRPKADPEVAGLSAMTDKTTWVECAHMYDPALEQKIRADKIDILIALCSHGPMGRLPILARHAAPVQISYLGSPGTTGLKAVGSRITDSIMDPSGDTDALSIEKLFRTTGPSFAYAGPDDAPSVNERGNAPITFACLGNPQKINDQVLDAWAAILKKVPDSRLLLKHAYLESAATRDHLTQSLASRGITADRLDLEPHTPDFRDHLSTYHRADIALDTFPYSGMATTCEALWMGVPVITLAGDRHAGRMGQSLLTAAGLTDWITTSPDTYTAKAVALAKDAAKRADLRRTLRDKLKSSPLCTGGQSLARQLEDHYRSMWKTFVGGVYYAGAAEPVAFVKE